MSHHPGEHDLCPRCDAAIFWAETTSLRMLPVDAAPDPQGNLIMFPNYRVYVLGPGDKLKPGKGAVRWRSHRATCRYAPELVLARHPRLSTQR